FPNLTIQGSIQAVLQVSLFCLYFSSRFSPKDQLRIIGFAMGITVMANLFYVIALPSIGLHMGDKFHGAWKGFYANKNEFSGTMLWSLVVFYLLSFKNSNRVVAVLARAGLIVCPLLVILSTSKTALVIFIFLYFALTVWNRYRWHGAQTILTVDLAILSSFLVVGGIINNWAKLVSTLGKDPTMSGRTDIWSAAMIEINHKPLFGYGFSAFWTEDNPAALNIGNSLHPGFYTYNAHNGFIDIVLNVGWIGLALFMVCFVLTWLLALKYAYRPSSPEDFWPLAVMLLVTSYNITESSFLTDNLNWVLFVSATLSVRIWPRQRLTQSKSKPLQDRHLQKPPAIATREKALASSLSSTKRTF
ncbi:MAG: O-antigen ligase family protein, partial [Cyanobacteria bacterium J06555_13]